MSTVLHRMDCGWFTIIQIAVGNFQTFFSHVSTFHKEQMFAFYHVALKNSCKEFSLCPWLTTHRICNAIPTVFKK